MFHFLQKNPKVFKKLADIYITAGNILFIIYYLVLNFGGAKMTSTVNSNQLNAMAKEIAKLLDSKEQTESTRGDGQVEASIWNKFVGDGKPKEKQIGNGEKSKIQARISFQNAVSSIALYIKNKGLPAVQEALKELGIEYNQSAEATNSDTNVTDKKIAKSKNIDQEALKKLEENDKKAEAKFAEIEKQKDTVKTTVTINGLEKEMTYNEIMSQLYSFKSRMSMCGVTHDKKTGKPRFPRLSEIHAHLRYWATKKDKHAKELLAELESLLAAKANIEKDHPDFKNVEYTVVKMEDGTTRYWDTKIDKFIDE